MKNIKSAGKIIDYRVVSSASANSFNDGISKKIAEGWQPYGKFKCAMNNNQILFIQPLVKYEPFSND